MAPLLLPSTLTLRGGCSLGLGVPAACLSPGQSAPLASAGPSGRRCVYAESILMWFVLGRLLFSGLCLFKDALEEFQQVLRTGFCLGRAGGQGPDSCLSQHARHAPCPPEGRP